MTNLTLLFIICLFFVSAAKISSDDDVEDMKQMPDDIFSRRSSYFFRVPNKNDILTKYENITVDRTLIAMLGHIAFYLRISKEFLVDPRTSQHVNIYHQYPQPYLKRLHASLEESCTTGFGECVETAHKFVMNSYFFKSAFFGFHNENYNKSTRTERSSVTKNVTEELYKLYRSPFADLEQQFEFVISLSYYFCWFTMLELPVLAHLSYCAWTDTWKAAFVGPILLQWPFGFMIDELDPVPFRCAKFSFCPDPCCYRQSMDQSNCDEDESNPCRFQMNKKCVTKPEENQDFVAIVQQPLHATCMCERSGFKFERSIGACFDDDECEKDKNICYNNLHSSCVNTISSYICACKLGFAKNQSGFCVEDDKQQIRRESSDIGQSLNPSFGLIFVIVLFYFIVANI